MTHQPLTAPCAREGCDVIRVQRPGQCDAYFRRIKYCCHECSMLAKGPGRPKPAKREPRMCAGKRCRVVFMPKRRNHRYCSDRCRSGGQAKEKLPAVYDGGAQKASEVLADRPVYDVRNLPADDGRLWT